MYYLIELFKPVELVSVGSLLHVVLCHSAQFMLTLYVSSSFLVDSLPPVTPICAKSMSELMPLPL